jgi:hypothetical protein
MRMRIGISLATACRHEDEALSACIIAGLVRACLAPKAKNVVAECGQHALPWSRGQFPALAGEIRPAEEVAWVWLGMLLMCVHNGDTVLDVDSGVFLREVKEWRTDSGLWPE